MWVWTNLGPSTEAVSAASCAKTFLYRATGTRTTRTHISGFAQKWTRACTADMPLNFIRIRRLGADRWCCRVVTHERNVSILCCHISLKGFFRPSIGYNDCVAALSNIVDGNPPKNLHFFTYLPPSIFFSPSLSLSLSLSPERAERAKSAATTVGHFGRPGVKK